MDRPEDKNKSVPSTNNTGTSQENRDRLMRANRRRSRCKHNDSFAERSRKIKLARSLIKDLENHGPAGLVHIAALSSASGRPIRIWSSEEQINRTIGQRRTETPVDIQYNPTKPNDTGHWTLRGGADPQCTEIDLNSCLFSVVASQINASPAELRTKTIRKLKRNLRLLADHIDDILWLDKFEKRSLMLGGAKYIGVAENYARIILDNSQNVLCDGCNEVGHPRGHASCPSATGPNDSVENYSRGGGMKSGFLSRKDQNVVAHHALSHREAQHAMRQLNEGRYSQAVTIPARELENSQFRLPMMKEYRYGEAVTDELPIVQLVLVLRHHAGKSGDPDADVFVHTFYPKRS